MKILGIGTDIVNIKRMKKFQLSFHQFFKLSEYSKKKGIILQLGVFITQKCYFSHINYKDWKLCKK